MVAQRSEGCGCGGKATRSIDSAGWRCVAIAVWWLVLALQPIPGFAGTVARMAVPSASEPNGVGQVVEPQPALGGSVLFANRITGTLDAPVRGLDGALLDGGRYQAQVYAARVGRRLMAVGSAIPFRSGVAAGYFTGGTVFVPTVEPGEECVVQVRAWDGDSGTSFEAALAAGGAWGASPAFLVTTGNQGSPPSTPGVMRGLTPFSLRTGAPAMPEFSALVVTPAEPVVGEPVEIRIPSPVDSALSYVWRIDSTVVGWSNDGILRRDAAAPGVYTVQVDGPGMAGTGGTAEGSASRILFELFEGYALDVLVGRGGTVRSEPPPGSVFAGTEVVLRADPLPGYRFAGWGGDASGTENPLTLRMTGPRRVTAAFEIEAGTVWLGNRVPDAGLDAPVLGEDGATRLVGPGFVAQLYARSLGTDGALVPLGDSVAIGGGEAAGYFGPQLQVLPGLAPGAGLWVEVRVWNLGDGASFEAAVASGGRVGVSAGFEVRTGNGGSPPAPPAVLAGLRSFVVRAARMPTIASAASLRSVWAGQRVEFTTEVTGHPTPVLQWIKNDVALPGAFESDLRLEAAALDDAGVYRLRATSVLGSATSESMVLDVLPRLEIVGLSVPAWVWAGAYAVAHVDVRGVPSGFQWYRGERGDVSAPAASGSADFETPPLLEPATYWVRVTDAIGQVDSPAVRIEAHRREQHLTFPTPVVTYGDAPVRLGAVSDSGLEVEYVVVSGPVALVGADRLTAMEAGVVVLQARQPGDARFLPATPVEREFRVAQHPASVVFGRLEQQVDGTPRVVEVRTEPAGLAVEVTYDGRAVAPVDEGDYRVVATVIDRNYTGTATGTLQVRAPSWDVAVVVFDDLDGDGWRGPAELGVEGAVVRLSGPNIDVTRSTDGAGHLEFGGLREGAYRVEELVPEGVVPSSLRERSLRLGPGLDPPRVAFGHQAPATVAGRVFVDINGDGEAGIEEVGLSGVEVRVTQGGDEHRQRTDSDGVFRFEGLATGAVVVEEIDPEGFDSTTPNQRTAYLARGGAATVVFGDREMRWIGGVVFEDRNGNEVADPNEPGVPGVTIRLRRVGDPDFLRTTVTDAHGAFAFRGLGPGEYEVEKDAIGGVSAASAGARGLATLPGALASAVAAETTVDQAWLLSLAEGGSASVNFGTHAVGRLTGVVFDDVDGDGRPGPGEPGLAGVRVELRSADGASVRDAAVTGTDGSYAIEGCEVGRSVVRQETVAGYAAEALDAVIQWDGKAPLVANFANRVERTISGRVFLDEDRNGTADRGEAALAGIEVWLEESGQALRKQATALDGRFRFTVTGSGTGRVGVMLPDGFRSTGPSEQAWGAGLPEGAGVGFGLRAKGSGGPYAAWCREQELTGADANSEADPDRDGVANLWEFVLGTSATTANVEAGPAAAVVRGLSSGPRAGFLVRRSVGAVEARIGLMVSEDLVTWRRVEPMISLKETEPAHETLRVLDPQGLATGRARFVRMVVELPAEDE